MSKNDWTQDSNELELYIKNTGELYRQRILIEQNLQKKFDKGLIEPFHKRAYRSSKAVKLWMYWIDEGCKSYKKELNVPIPWYKIFSIKNRLEVAITMENEHFEEMTAQIDLSDDQVLIMKSKHST